MQVDSILKIGSCWPFGFSWGDLLPTVGMPKPVGWNILFILTLGGLGIWAIIDLIQIITQDFM